jgi:lipoate-protein ligase A
MRPDPFEPNTSIEPSEPCVPEVRAGRISAASTPGTHDSGRPVVSISGFSDPGHLLDPVSVPGEETAPNTSSNILSVSSWSEDDDLIDAVKLGGITRVKVTILERTMVVLGRGSKPEVELNIGACLADGVEVTRRPGGGCSVVLDPGNIVISIVSPVPGLGNIQSSFGRLTAWIIDGLTQAGIHGVTVRPVSDLVLGDGKVGGSCIHRSRDLLYFSATLLVSPDIDLIGRYLAHPPREPAYRRGRPHREFLTTLPAPDGIEALKDRLDDILRSDSIKRPYGAVYVEDIKRSGQTRLPRRSV